MSIMVNSSKTPTGKSKKGQVSIRVDSGSVKACFPRSYCNKGQIKLGTGIAPINGWESKASQLQRRLQIELEDGKLDDGEGNFQLGRYQEILKEYGLQAKLRLVKGSATPADQPPPKPELSLMEIWDMYCEYRKHDLAETTLNQDYQGIYKNFLQSAIEATKTEDALKIRNWLLENRNICTVKKVLSATSKAYDLLIRQKLISHNPYNGLIFDIGKVLGSQGYTADDKEDEEDDSDILNIVKAYTWNEALTILDYVKNHPTRCHWYNFIKFKFLTGVRTGEAIGLWWRDVKWENESLIIQRTYNSKIKKFKPTKNETIRRFPMPKDGELWNLLKSIPQGGANEVVFKSKRGGTINSDVFRVAWHGRQDKNDTGLIPQLIEEGKLTKYLRPYNTRHTFITHQVFDLGRDEKIVNAWCEHSENTSRKHYQDIADRALHINPELPVTTSQQAQQQSEFDSLKEQLKKQQELIDQLLKGKQ